MISKILHFFSHCFFLIFQENISKPSDFMMIIKPSCFLMISEDIKNNTDTQLGNFICHIIVDSKILYQHSKLCSTLLDLIWLTSLFRALPQLTPTPLNLTLLQVSMQAYKNHYQPPNGRHFCIVHYVPFRWVATQSYCIYWKQEIVKY